MYEPREVVRENIQVKVTVGRVRDMVKLQMNPIVIRLEESKTCKGAMNILLKSLEQVVQVVSTDEALAWALYNELDQLKTQTYNNIMRLKGYTLSQVPE